VVIPRHTDQLLGVRYEHDPVSAPQDLRSVYATFQFPVGWSHRQATA